MAGEDARFRTLRVDYWATAAADRHRIYRDSLRLRFFEEESVTVLHSRLLLITSSG